MIVPLDLNVLVFPSEQMVNEVLKNKRSIEGEERKLELQSICSCRTDPSVVSCRILFVLWEDESGDLSPVV